MPRVHPRPRRRRTVCALILILAFFPPILRAVRPGGGNPRGYVCVRATVAPVIDGDLSDIAWRAARWSGEFVDIEGSIRPPPRFRTRVKMLWDSAYFFIGAELQEPQLQGSLTQRDTVIFHDNDFEVFVDPDGDNHEYYEMEMNALNTVWDLLLKKPYRDGGPPVDAWDIRGLKTAVRLRGTINAPADRDTGWAVEIAMPWSSLAEYAHRPAPPAPGDQWRINFSRVEWRFDVVEGRYRKAQGIREDNWVWSPQGVVDMHRPEMWGYVQFAGPQGRQTDFHPDPARRAKDILFSIYAAQKQFREMRSRWASNLAELGLARIPLDGLTDPPGLSLTSEGFLATATARLPKRKKDTWFIRQDSRLWREE